ncbi:MAG: hypothetical protein ACJAXJ_001753 [Colwellia sp.]|jgi:hypothetical protein
MGLTLHKKQYQLNDGYKQSSDKNKAIYLIEPCYITILNRVIYCMESKRLSFASRLASFSFI